MVDTPQMLPYASIEPEQPPVGTEEPRPRPAGEAPDANNIQRGRRKPRASWRPTLGSAGRTDAIRGNPASLTRPVFTRYRSRWYREFVRSTLDKRGEGSPYKWGSLARLAPQPRAQRLAALYRFACTRPHKAPNLEAALRVFRASPATIVLMRTQLKLNIRSRGAMSGVLTMGSLDPTFEAAASVDGEMVVLDLRPVEFVEPAGLCGLAGHNVPAYLERMNFFRIFGHRIETNVDVESLEERRRGNPGTLQELVNFHSEEEIPGIINRISEILENKEYRLRERAAICATLSEICSNAVEHGHSPFGAYAAVQAYQHIVSGPRSRGERQGEEVLVAIADGGVGVRETLSRNPNYAKFTETDNDALRHALKMGVSGTGEVGRGGGLAVVGQISARAGGSLSLRSASGRVTYYGDRTSSRNVSDFPGTFVRVSLPRKAEA